MNTSPRRTEGATLFVVVLMVLFLLAAVMAITAQFTLAGKRSTGDQENTIRAQYAAESTIARVQARLNIINRVFTPGTIGTVKMGMTISSDTDSATMENQIKTLCAINTLPLASMDTPVCGTTDPKSNIFANTTDPTARLALFTAASPTTPPVQFVSDAALAAAGGPPVGSSMATKQAFWAKSFVTGSSPNLTDTINGFATEGQGGIVISSVWRKTADEYEIRFRIPSVNVRASSTAATRALGIDPQSTEYVLSFGRPPLAKYALFTNHHFSDANAEQGKSRITFTSNTKFSGPVHTNQQFNFQGNPTFSGPVTSAGCIAGSLLADGSGCSSTAAGAYFYSNNFQSGKKGDPSVLLDSSGNPVTKPYWSSSSGTSNPQFNWQPTTTVPDAPINWNSGYQQLPPNSQDQVIDAKAGGLYINGTVSKMALSVGSITPAGGVSQNVQNITYTVGTTTTQMAVNASGQTFIFVATPAPGKWVPAIQSGATGEWVAAAAGVPAGIFNGVIYANASAGADGISNLTGPARNPATATTSTAGNTPPAIAKFMKMNIVSNSTMKITSDLRYEDPPCDDNGICNNQTAKNILGIYSSSGDVQIVNKYTCTYDSRGNCTGYTTRTSPYAPPNVTIQSVLMASAGKVTVDGYDAGPTNATDRGTVNLTGGIIENYYGAFGVTNGTGYGRNFVYDPRTSRGILPPSFPTTKNWTSNLQSQLVLTTGAQVQLSNDQYIYRKANP